MPRLLIVIVVIAALSVVACRSSGTSEVEKPPRLDVEYLQTWSSPGNCFYCVTDRETGQRWLFAWNNSGSIALSPMQSVKP